VSDELSFKTIRDEIKWPKCYSQLAKGNQFISSLMLSAASSSDTVAAIYLLHEEEEQHVSLG
jgi:hypothetical protein